MNIYVVPLGAYELAASALEMDFIRVFAEQLKNFKLECVRHRVNQQSL